MLTNINLCDKEMTFITKVQCIKTDPMPDIIICANRHFIRYTDGIYKEGFAIAILTEEEYKEILNETGI